MEGVSEYMEEVLTGSGKGLGMNVGERIEGIYVNARGLKSR